jgi:hypothetical protein
LKKSKDSLTTSTLSDVENRINDHRLSVQDQLDQVNTLAEERLKTADYLGSVLESILPSLPERARPKDAYDNLARLKKAKERFGS